MEQQKIQVPMLQKSVTTELSEEFSIPDYQPEIRRILRVEAQVMPADRYVGPGSAEFSGKVNYKIYYLGEDGELYGTAFSGDYRVVEPVELPGGISLSEGVLCDADVFSESVMYRLLSPRKFLVKTRLCSQIRLYGTRTLDEEIPEGCSVERLEKTCFVAEESVGTSERFHVFHELLLDSTASPLRVAAGEGHVLVSDVTPGNGVLSCRGEVMMKLFTVKEDDTHDVRILLCKEPFAAEVPLDGAGVGSAATAKGIVTDLSITVEDGRVLTDAEVCLDVRSLQKKAISYTEDLFALGQDAELVRESCRIPTLIQCGVGNFTLSTSIPISDAGIGKDHRVVDLSLNPFADSVSTAGGRLLLTGKCHCRAILENGGEWSSSEFDLPFRYDGRASEESDVTDLMVSLDALSCRARKEDNALFVDAEIAVSVRAKGETVITRVASVAPGEPEAASPAMRICYPSRGDTLWSVAKRYHKPVETLVAANTLPSAPAADAPDSLSGVKFLVV